MKEEKRAEILAPAGGLPQLKAAAAAGADAVYLGGQAFNARMYAQNFTSMATTVETAHRLGMKVYVTLNVLVRDDEWEQMGKAAEEIAAAGADGVIVQDLGVASYLRRRFPTLPLHASTQMVIHNAAGVRLLEDMGFVQVVPARELSLEELKLLCSSTSLAVEAFVHGAQCMSVSGACYLSGMLGERSGNRGSCAQTCRLPFRAGTRTFALSLKDMSNIEHIPQLTEAGVRSLKIEGRMKGPAYVYGVVKACRDVMEGKTPNMKQLERLFSREGFTDGYLLGKRTLDMFGHRTEENIKASKAAADKQAPPKDDAVSRTSLPTFPHLPAQEEPLAQVPKSFRPNSRPPKMRIMCRELTQIPKNLQDVEQLILPVEVLAEQPDRCADKKIAAELPALIFPFREEKLLRQLETLKQAGLQSVVVQNLGALQMAREMGLPMYGGYGLNILNSGAVSAAKNLGLTDVTVSFELFLKKVQALRRPLPIGIMGYGYLPAMQLRACPAQTNQGCKGCSGKPVLTDRKNVRFPLICHGKQFTTLHNSIPLYMGDRGRDLAGLDFVTISFTVEPPSQCEKVLRLFREGKPADFPFTRGAYTRKLF